MNEKKHLRVVLADDEEHIRKLMSVVISGMGCTIVGEANNGDMAIEMYREEKPDLLLLDINMPQKTGKEALGELLEEFPHANVIMFTSISDMEDVEDCLAMGALNYIRKDTAWKEIKSIIWETFENAEESKGADVVENSDPAAEEDLDHV